MARRVDVTLLDDLTGEPASSTVVFGFRGAWFELDVSDDNADTITALLTEWSTHGRRRHDHRDDSTRRGLADRARSAAIRSWARANKMTVAEKGRLPAGIIRAYESRPTDSRIREVRTRLENAPAPRRRRR